MYRITLSSWHTFTNCSKAYFSSKNNIKKQPSEKFCEKGVLKISLNSQENTCARVSFITTLSKKETLAQVFFCEFCEIFKNNFSDKTPLVAASEHLTQHFH